GKRAHGHDRAHLATRPDPGRRVRRLPALGLPSRRLTPRAGADRRCAMKNLCVILLSLALLACGGVQHGGARAPLPIDALRARVANAPDDAALVSELAAAELLWEGGDATRARAVIDRALTMRSD